MKRKPNNRVIIAIIISVVAVIALKLTSEARMSTINDFQISRHFNLREFISPDTDEAKIDYHLVVICERLRRELDIPIAITSGYRTKTHNKKVGGSKDSYHIKGLAVDMVPKGESLRKLFVKATKIKKVGGLGWYQDSHIHIDLRENRIYWVKLKGKPIKYFEHFVGVISYYTAKTIAKITL